MSITTDRITKTPGVCGGNACIRDHRIPVWGLIEARRLGLSDARLLASYPGIEQDDLEAAWEYARENPLEIERAIWPNQAVMEQRGGDLRLALLVRGWQLGLSDAEIAEPFEPPMNAADLQAAREAYLARKDDFDRALATLLPEELREGLQVNGSSVCG